MKQVLLSSGKASYARELIVIIGGTRIRLLPGKQVTVSHYTWLVMCVYLDNLNVN